MGPWKQTEGLGLPGFPLPSNLEFLQVLIPDVFASFLLRDKGSLKDELQQDRAAHDLETPHELRSTLG